jgi:hypothetical protein
MKRLLAAIALLPTLAFAEESAWGTFTNEPVDGLIWEYKRGSLDLAKNDDGSMYWTYIFRTSRKGGTKFDFVKIAVPTRGCAKQNGTLFILAMNNEKQAEIPFVFDGGTLGSAIAQNICKQGDLVLEKVKKEEEPKPTAT